MQCECCRSPITVGEQYVMLYGRPWRTEHAQRYQKERRAIAASGGRRT